MLFKRVKEGSRTSKTSKWKRIISKIGYLVLICTIIFIVFLPILYAIWLISSGNLSENYVNPIVALTTAVSLLLFYLLHPGIKWAWHKFTYKEPTIKVLPYDLDSLFRPRDEALRKELRKDPLKQEKELMKKIVEEWDDNFLF